MAVCGDVQLFVCALTALPLLVVGCATSVVQTAELAPNAAPDCSVRGALVLPSDGPFGDERETVSALVGDSYSAGQGPGLYVTARDAFRVYLNGELVTVSRAARAPLFVPLTLLPGDNALAVVVAAESGTPAALLQLDELEQSTVSDATWKVSTAPLPGFTDFDFDDSSWPVAQDFGALGALPGCDPGAPFEASSPAHWIGPENGSGSVAVLRKVIRIRALGYGQSTTGGFGAALTFVDSWAEFSSAASDPDAPAVILLGEGVHDFRDTPRDQNVCPAVCENDASKSQYVVLTTGQTCAEPTVTKPRYARRIALGSNKTVVGLGRGAQLRGVTFDFGASQNSIVRNVALYDVNRELIEAGDAFSLDQARQIWIDHATTKWISDGFTDISAGSQNITLSWLHYDGVTNHECEGQHTRASMITDSTVTFAHCFFDHVQTHAPSVRGALARVHLFNNVIGDDLGYGVSAECGARVLLEGNTFQRVATPTVRSTCADDTLLGLIDAPSGSNSYTDVGPHRGGNGQEPHDAVFEPPYEYRVGGAKDEWRTVSARAGAGGPWAQPLVAD